METKNSQEQCSIPFRILLIKNHFSAPPVGLSCGLMLSWKEDVHVDILYSSCNIIDTVVKSKTFSFYVSFIYGTQKKEDRPAFWSKLVELGKAREDAWLLTGDFNDLLDNEEKVGGPLRWEGSFLAVGPNFGQYINGPRSKAWPKWTEARSKRRLRGPGDRGAVTEITRSTYYKGRRVDMKKHTLKT